MNIEEQPVEAPPTPAGGGVAGFERLGKFRDSLLVAGGALYVLGYVVWSVHALGEGLGLLPALELQYLLAGSLLALILLGALLLGFAAMRVAYASEKWTSRRRSVRLLASAVPGACGGAAGLLAVALWLLAGHSLITISLILVLGGFGFAPLLSLKRFKAHERYLLVFFTGGLIALAATVFYVSIAYPNVPQELGGVKPRCAFVEVDRADASGLLAEQLFPPSKRKDGIARSRQLSIFFSGGDAYVVRVRGLEDAHTYELRKEIVKSTSDC